MCAGVDLEGVILDGSKRVGRGVPAYQRLSADLRAALKEGRFGTEESLPTEVDLAREYGVSRPTVRRAFQDLVAEGLVYRTPGKGTFPTALSRDSHYLGQIGTIEDLTAFAGTEMEVMQPVELKADPEAASLLELPSRAVAAVVLRRLYEGVPFGLSRIYLPPELGTRLVEADALPARGDTTVIGTLERLMSRIVAGANQVITAVPMPEDVAPVIDAEAGEPSLRVQRLYIDDHEIPVELAVSYYNPRRYSHHLKMRRRTIPGRKPKSG
ncbi:MAG TPA: GntR family transcriptional regulator [Rubrobacteraceae bacterium]|nr:GntR family transcriptional regulator [Rubrobacteraceae bacterium]